VRAEEQLSALLETAEEAGASPRAGALIQDASKVRGAEPRKQAMQETLGLQQRVVDGIDSVLRYLQKWSTYQSLVRQVKEAYEAQQGVGEGIRKGPGD